MVPLPPSFGGGVVLLTCEMDWGRRFSRSRPPSSLHYGKDSATMPVSLAIGLRDEGTSESLLSPPP